MSDTNPDAGRCEVCGEPGDWSSEMRYRVLCQVHDRRRTDAIRSARDYAEDLWDKAHQAKFNESVYSETAMKILKKEAEKHG